VEKGGLRHENNHKSIACSDHNDYFEHGVAADIPETALLKAWNAEFLKDIVHVVDNVYTFTGYSVQSVSMIVGKDGLIIVDTGIDSASTKKVLAIMRKITTLAIKAILIAHEHSERIGGILVFMKEGCPRIWVMSNFRDEAYSFKREGLSA